MDPYRRTAAKPGGYTAWMYEAVNLRIAGRLCTVACTVALLGCHSLPSPAPRAAPFTARSPSLPAARTGAAPDPVAAVRQAFRDALLRVPAEPSQAWSSANDPPALRSYVLYDYLIAARLQFALQSAPGDALDAAIDSFLRTHAGQPVTRDLRRQWLESLADRHRWNWFLPRATQVSDPLLVCDRLAGRLATGDTAGLAAEALAWWQQPISQPSACDDVFAWLAQHNELTPALRAQRMRTALMAGNVPVAREFAAGVPAALLPPLRLWLRMLQSPRSTLRALAAHPQAPVEPQALAAAFRLLSLHDSASAVALLPRLLARPDITAALHLRLARDAALGLAYDHDPAALTAFLALPGSADSQLLYDPSASGIGADASVVRLFEWRVRAALWAGDFRQALAWINAMPASLGTQPRWRYWRARATEATAGPAAAAPLYADIAGLRGYYGYLAADRLHRPYDLNDHATPEDPTVQRTLQSEPGLIRARELLACGLYDDAVAEWGAAIADGSAAIRIQAAYLAAHWGWYAQSIATLAQTGDWDDVRLRYPRPYADLIAAASSHTQLPADWILSVMRQESLFRPDAVSRADARGLMQLELSTAEDVAQRWHLPAPDASSLYDPTVAITLGAAHLRELLDRYDGRIALALAAYNAGSDALARWLPDRPMDADIWIENIPYDETRTYVEAIIEHIVAYSWTRGATLPQLAALLPPVGPAAPVTPLQAGSSGPLSEPLSKRERHGQQ